MHTIDVSSAVSAIAEQLVAWRRHLHENPELSFQEVETSRFVHDQLAAMGYTEIERPTPTSVVARLRGAKPGKTLAIRADMDALPIEEENTFPYRSKRPGVMHACGHDGHTAMLLGTAKILMEHRDALQGEVRFLFQHAEEQFPGGAQEMVKAGVLDGVDLVIGTHLAAQFPTGKIGVRAGAVTAAPDVFRIRVRGRGGHGAMPHETVDPIVVGAQIVNTFQHIVSRFTDPLDKLVVSVCEFHAGTADSIIPDMAELVGTVRSLNPALRDEVPAQMRRLLDGLEVMYGAKIEFEYERGYASVVNDAELTDRMRAIAEQVVGADNVIDMHPLMVGEDFSAFAERVPGCYFYTGSANPALASDFPHHHPRFTIDEAALQNGVAMFVTAALAFLG